MFTYIYVAKGKGGVMGGVTYGIRTILQHIFTNTCSSSLMYMRMWPELLKH